CACAAALFFAPDAKAEDAFEYRLGSQDGIDIISSHRIGLENGGPLSVAIMKLRVVGSYPQQYIFVFGCDPQTFVTQEMEYACKNLEDSEYFSNAMAERIRAIAQSAYPFVPLDKMVSDANGALGDMRFSDISEDDAIAAAQAAIWSCADCDSSFSEPTATYGYKDTRGPSGRYTPNSTNRSRVNGLRDWLLSLPPKTANTPIAGIDLSAEPLSSSSGFKMRISYWANGRDAAGGTIPLCAASFDGSISEARSLGDGRFTLLLESRRSEQSSMNLAVMGTQQIGEDAYLYCAKGGRKASQCFVGVARGAEVSICEKFYCRRDHCIMRRAPECDALRRSVCVGVEERHNSKFQLCIAGSYNQHASTWQNAPDVAVRGLLPVG
ncbi:MAG: Cys-Gln thioester bond-forming surface protein, partial [Oscillospiraceae bacterium]